MNKIFVVRGTLVGMNDRGVGVSWGFERILTYVYMSTGHL